LKYNLTTYRHSFRGKDAVIALVQHYPYLSESQAIGYGKILQRLLILDHVVGAHEFDNTGMFFRLTCDQTPHVLNSYRTNGTEQALLVPNSVMGLLNRLTNMLGNILSAHTMDNFKNNGGNKVDYKAARSHVNFCIFEEAVCELHKVPYNRLPYETKLAFSINLYNLMIKYAFLKVGIFGTSDLSSRLGFFNSVTFQIGPDLFSFQDLENGILRANRKAPFSLAHHPFGPKDDRLRFSMPKVDCRIHFALNCGAKSCLPQVHNFTALGIEQELQIVAQDFCQDDAQVNIKEKDMTLSLSEIFRWYREDFCSCTADLPKAVLKYLKGPKKQTLERMLLKGTASCVKVKFIPYDWSTNASDFVPFTGGSVKANSSRFL
jgi:hypothetical protein